MADQAQTPPPATSTADGAVLTFLAALAAGALILLIAGAPQKTPINQIIIECTGAALLLGILGLAAASLSSRRHTGPKHQHVNHPRSLGMAVALNLLVFVCLVAILTIGMTEFGVDTTLSLPIMAIAGVVALIGTLSLAAISFSIMNLADKTQPLALPQGSVRAVIALSLVVLFAILTVYLFSSLDAPTKTHTIECVATQDHAKLITAIQSGGANLLVDIPSAAGCPPPTPLPPTGAQPNSGAAAAPAAPAPPAASPPAGASGAAPVIHAHHTAGSGGPPKITPAPATPPTTNTGGPAPGATPPTTPPTITPGAPGAPVTNPSPAPTTYQVIFRIPSNPDAVDFAKQLLILIGTLVTSVASFYFGSQAVSQAQAVVSGIAQAAALTGVSTPQLEAKSDTQTLGILGTNLNTVGQVQLATPDGSSTINATSVTSNAARVQADFNLSQPATLSGKTYDVVVTDTLGRTAKLPGAVTVGPATPPNPTTPTPTPPPADPQLANNLATAGTALANQAENLAALKLLPPGTPGSPPDTISDAISAAQQALGKLTAGGDQTGAAAALSVANTALAAAQNQGLPAALADVLSTLQGLAKVATPIIAGIPAGPIGIVGGVLLAGIQFYNDQQKFNTLKAALLNTPFTPALLPPLSDGNAAMAAIQATPLLAGVTGLATNALNAEKVMQAALQTANTVPLPSSTVAATLLQDSDVNTLLAGFTLPQLAAAVDQLRSAAVFQQAQKILTGTIDISGVVPDGGALSIAALLDDARKLAADPKGQSAIEQLVAVAEALAKAPASATLNSRLKDALAAAQTIAATARQAS